MKNDRVLRSALLSLILNLIFSFYNGAIGIINHSWWFITLSAYYIILSVMRFEILLSTRKEINQPVSELFIMRFTGILFIFLSVILAGTTYLSFINDRGIKYHEIVMITIALYSFSKVTFAIVNLVKIRNINSPILKTLRNISFADSLVSIFSLQRSMLVSFEGMTEYNIQLFNSLVGSAVYILVFLLGINLIGGKKVNMAKSKLVKANEKIAETVVGGYKKIEKGVVDGFKKIEDGVVSGYTKIEDKFVDQFLTHDGETVEEAKARLKKNDEQ